MEFQNKILPGEIVFLNPNTKSYSYIEQPKHAKNQPLM